MHCQYCYKKLSKGNNLVIYYKILNEIWKKLIKNS